ncbi:MAG: hypothetical protein KJ821_00350 [Actinobacteria bacterium]|nr:hypothetical protein [Actinomycetota bacterium]
MEKSKDKRSSSKTTNFGKILLTYIIGVDPLSVPHALFQQGAQAAA